MAKHPTADMSKIGKKSRIAVRAHTIKNAVAKKSLSSKRFDVAHSKLSRKSLREEEEEKAARQKKLWGGKSISERLYQRPPVKARSFKARPAPAILGKPGNQASGVPRAASLKVSTASRCGKVATTPKRVSPTLYSSMGAGLQETKLARTPKNTLHSKPTVSSAIKSRPKLKKFDAAESIKASGKALPWKNKVIVSKVLPSVLKIPKMAVTGFDSESKIVVKRLGNRN